MKVFIITEGGRDIGIGHITRCISLCQAFEEKGIEPEFIVNGDDSVISLLKVRSYQVFNWIKERRRLFEGVRNADIAIIDSYLADIYIYERLSKIVKIPICIDDNKRLEYPRGVVVNGSMYAKKLYYPIKNSVSYLLGVKYIPIRETFWNVPGNIIKENIENVMITMGGVDTLNITPEILKMLVSSFPKLIKKVILGSGFQNIDDIKNAADNNTKLINNPDEKKMQRIMSESDIAISAGGQTTYELARMGLPVIILCLAENQINNIRAMREKGFAQYAGHYGDIDIFTKIKKKLRILKPQKVRQKISNIGRKLVDGKGARRIVKEGALL